MAIEDDLPTTKAHTAPEEMTRDELIAELKRWRAGDAAMIGTSAHDNDNDNDNDNDTDNDNPHDNERLREAQMELAELGARSIDLYETVPVACCILDAKGIVRELNREAAKLLGGETSSLRGRPLAHFVNARERRRVTEHVSAAVAEQLPAALTVTMRALGAAPPVVIKMVSHHLGKDGTGCRTALFDVTDETRAEEALRIAVRTREDFLAVVAHDLRSPIAAVSMSADLLERQHSPEQKRAIGVIRRATARMNRLVGDLLDVSSMDTGHLAIDPAHENLEQLVVTALEICSPMAAAKQLSLSSHVDRGPLHGWCDRERVIQALLNLLANAIKFTSSGAISVRGRRFSADEVVLSVHDTGKGMSRPQIEHAFDRYWQAAPQPRDGMGLGLSIVKGIAELHGGRVWIESTSGRGTSVSFTLPARQPGVVDPLANDVTAPLQLPDVSNDMSNDVASLSSISSITIAAPVAVRTGPLVLLVDDEKAVRESIAEALRSEGYEVVALSHGRAALDYLDSAQEMPAVILLDLVMPVMDGWEFLRQQSRLPRLAAVPVVLVSGQADRAGAEQLQQLAGYIQKPVRLANLCEVVGNCATASL